MEKEVILKVTQMSCGHCEKAVEQAVSKVDGVINYSADSTKDIVSVTYNPERCSVDDIIHAVQETEIYTVSH
jgi:P-type Cu+ transporter